MNEEDLFVQDEVTGEVAQDEVHDFGNKLDNAIKSLNVDINTNSKSDVIFHYIAFLENNIYRNGLWSLDFDEILGPLLDFIAPRFPEGPISSDPGKALLRQFNRWAFISKRYYVLTGALMNCLQNRMHCLRTKDGRIVFTPLPSLFEAEMRNRWFENQWRKNREELADHLLNTDSARDFFRLLDEQIAEQLCQTRISGRFSISNEENWGFRHLDELSESILRAQMACIGEQEKWGDLSKDSIVLASKPLFSRALRLFLSHKRVFRYLSEHFQENFAPLCSGVEVVEKNNLVDEVKRAGNLSEDLARKFIDSLLRCGEQERHGPQSFPLIPFSENTVIFIPSIALKASWLKLWERFGSKWNNDALARARETRHTKVITRAANEAKKFHVSQNIKIKDPSSGEDLTDLDIVLVEKDGSGVLVLQLKSFLTPLNLLDFKKADSDVAKAIEQCDKAKDNPDVVKEAIEEKLHLSLTSDWSLYQIIVVEHLSGSAPNHDNYPIVVLEWIEKTFQEDCENVCFIWKSAHGSAKADCFSKGIIPFFEIFDDLASCLNTDLRAAVFSYMLADS